MGITGMDETFQEYFKKGKKPEDSTGNELVEDLKKLNFIADGAEEMYKKAFLIEYQRYYEVQEEMKIINKKRVRSDCTAPWNKLPAVI